MRLNAVIDVENQRYEEALHRFRRMHEIAKAMDHPATLAMSYLNIGTELERMGQQEEAIECLELARAYLMLHEVEKSVQAGQEFYKKAKLLKSHHAKSGAYRLLNTIETAGYGDVQVVKDFRYMLDHEEKDGLKELDASYYQLTSE